MAKWMSSRYRLTVVLLLLLMCIRHSTSLIVDGQWSQPSKISTPSRPYVLVEPSWSRKLTVHRAAAITCRALSPSRSIEALTESAAPVIEDSSEGGISSRKFVVVARGKARLFWCVYWLCPRKRENRPLYIYYCYLDHGNAICYTR